MDKRLDLLMLAPSLSGVYQKKQLESDYPAVEPPYLALLTAEFIRNRGYGVDLVDANAERLSIEESVRAVEERAPRLTHIVVHGNQPSASSQLMSWVNLACEKIKESSLDTKIILSGTHPSALPDKTLRETKCDFIGTGEGYFTDLGILEGRHLSEVPGLVYKLNGDIMRGARDKLIHPNEMREMLPKGAWDLAKMELYTAHDWHCLDNLKDRKPYASIYTSFGCGLGCVFCCIDWPFTMEGNVKSRIRGRNPESVVNEIQMLVENYGVKNLKFIDEMFVFDRRHYTAIAKGIIEKGLNKNLNIWAYARVDTANQGHLDLLRSAGFNWLVLGIESESEYVREGVDKGKFKREKIIETVREIQNAGINVLGNYMFGLPDETEETMQATLELALELNCERPNFYSTMSYPGSQLHIRGQNTAELITEHGKDAIDIIKKDIETVKNNGAHARYLPIPQGWNHNRALLPEEREKGAPGWIGYSQHAYETWSLPTAHLFPEQVLEFRDKALREYFMSPGYKSLLQRKFGANNTQEELDNFCKVNSRTPQRMILGHKKH